ncbi:hypothetical protein P9112_001664 [Eukaryota sp. TZLM1-RC]
MSDIYQENSDSTLSLTIMHHQDIQPQQHTSTKKKDEKETHPPPSSRKMKLKKSTRFLCLQTRKRQREQTWLSPLKEKEEKEEVIRTDPVPSPLKKNGLSMEVTTTDPAPSLFPNIESVTKGTDENPTLDTSSFTRRVS